MSPAADTFRGPSKQSEQIPPEKARKTESALHGCTTCCWHRGLRLGHKRAHEKHRLPKTSPRKAGRNVKASSSGYLSLAVVPAPTARLLAVGAGSQQHPPFHRPPLQTSCPCLPLHQVPAAHRWRRLLESSTHISCSSSGCPLQILALLFWREGPEVNPRARTETSRDGWRNLPPSFTELTCGGVSLRCCFQRESSKSPKDPV